MSLGIVLLFRLKELLHHYSLHSNEKLVILKNQEDLQTYLERRASSSTATVTAGLLSVDGAHALQGKLSNLDQLFDNGVRMMSLVRNVIAYFGRYCFSF